MTKNILEILYIRPLSDTGNHLWDALRRPLWFSLALFSPWPATSYPRPLSPRSLYCSLYCSLRALGLLSLPCLCLCHPGSPKCSGRYLFILNWTLPRLAPAEFTNSVLLPLCLQPHLPLLTSILVLKALCLRHSPCMFCGVDAPSVWHMIVHTTNCRTSCKRTWSRNVSFNPGHAGLGSGMMLGCGLSENSKDDGGWSNSLAARAIRPSVWQPCDNDFPLCRLVFRGMSISRPNAVVGRCRMIRHSRDKKNEPNPQRCVLCLFILLPPLGWGRLQVWGSAEGSGPRGKLRWSGYSGEGGGSTCNGFFLRFLF